MGTDIIEKILPGLPDILLREIMLRFLIAVFLVAGIKIYFC